MGFAIVFASKCGHFEIYPEPKSYFQWWMFLAKVL